MREFKNNETASLPAATNARNRIFLLCSLLVSTLDDAISRLDNKQDRSRPSCLSELANLRVAVIVNLLELPAKNKLLWHLLIEEIMREAEFDLTDSIEVGKLFVG